MPSPLRIIHRVVLLAVALVGMALPAGMPAGAEEAEPLPENPFERLAEIRERKAAAALEADLLRLSAVEIEERLAKVETWVATQEDVVAAAQAELVEATLAANEARTREESKAEELEELEALMAEIAVAAYMRPPRMAALDVVLTKDLASAEKADVMLRAKAQRDERVAEDLAEAEKSLRRLRVRAEDEAARANAAAEEAAAALTDLHQAQLEQVALAERVKADLAAAAEEAELLGGAEAETILAVQRETEAILDRIGVDAAVPLASVEGITVHADIAPAIESLLAAAEADGVVLAGWGHRSTARQVALRRQHCGGPGVSDSEAVYGRPASACSPPTAKPGTSMHELGLAIDFTHAGDSISTRSSPAFQWLAEHAGDYGLQNLPSEPWHWSVNGS